MYLQEALSVRRHSLHARIRRFAMRARCWSILTIVTMKTLLSAAFLVAVVLSRAQEVVREPVTWKHLSTAAGDIPVPSKGTQQTSLTVGDFGHDGHPGFVVTERTSPDSVVLYRRIGDTWKRSVIEPQPLHIEAGGVAVDVDGDGNLDYIAAGDFKSNGIWWWRNPYPHMDQPWKRYTIKHSGANKHHDQMKGDFDGSGQTTDYLLEPGWARSLHRENAC